MSDVPHQPVVRRVEDIVQRDGEFDRAEIGREVPAGLAHRIEQKLAQLPGELGQLLAVKLAQLLRVVDGCQQVVHQNFRSTMKSASWRRRSARSPKPPSASSASRRSSPASLFASATPSTLT